MRPPEGCAFDVAAQPCPLAGWPIPDCRVGDRDTNTTADKPRQALAEQPLSGECSRLNILTDPLTALLILDQPGIIDPVLHALDVLEAQERVREKAVDGENVYAHPHYWAAFSMEGVPD